MVRNRSRRPWHEAKSKPITTKQLADTLADQHELTKRQGKEMLEDLVGLITKHLKKGERVKIAGLGILQVRKRAARMGRNPATGEPIQIKASQAKSRSAPPRNSRWRSDRRRLVGAKTPPGRRRGFCFRLL